MSVSGRLLGVGDTSFLRSLDVQLIFLISMVSSMAAVASPTLPPMGADLGVSDAHIGLVFTAFTLPAIFALPIVGMIADLYGRKVVVVPGLLLFGGAGMAVGFVDDFSLILFLRGLQGVGYTAFNSLTVALLGDLLTDAEESAAQGTRVVLNKFTGFVAPAVSGVLAGFAWNYPFFLYAIAIPVGILAYLRLHVPTHATAEEETFEGTVAANETENGATRSRGLTEYIADLRDLSRDPYVVSVLGGGFFRMFMKYALYTYLAFAIVVQYGGSLGYAGLLIGLYSLVGAFVASQSARLTEGLTHSYALLIGFAIAGLGFIGFPLVESVLMVTVLVLVHGIGEGIINPVHKSILSQSVTSEVRAGFVTSNAIVQNSAKTLAPVVLAPLLVVGGGQAYDVLFLVTGIVVLFVTAIAFVLLKVGYLTPRHNAT